MQDLWKSVLDEIEVQISKPQFITFFKPTSLVSLENSVATIASPTSMIADYIEKRYYSLIKSSLDKKTKENTSLVFITKRIEQTTTTHEGPLFLDQTPKIAPAKRPSGIREDYTFDNFAVSDENQIAYTAASAVALEPGIKFNPLFMYGSVGVGKTHLMNAIANDVFSNNPRAKILYLTTEEFTNEVVEAIRDKQTTQMRKKLRNTDLLLLDDIQFLSGKDKVQEELFHTFNALIDKKKQVVLSSDRPPQEIKKVEDRIISRFQQGMTIDIDTPNFELRTAILLLKSKERGFELPEDLAQIAAEKIIESRALEGFITKLSGLLAFSHSSKVTPELVEQALGIHKGAQKRIHPDDIISAVCEYFDIKPTQLKGTKRTASLVKSRHICMYLLKETLGMTYVDIGNLLGGRDHTTVMHGVEKIRLLTSKENSNNEEILLIKKEIEETFLQ